MRTRTNTTFLLAGHGRRGLRQPPSAEQVARNIVRSIRDHAALGIVRTAEDYTARPATLALVYAALAENDSAEVR